VTAAFSSDLNSIASTVQAVLSCTHILSLHHFFRLDVMRDTEYTFVKAAHVRADTRTCAAFTGINTPDVNSCHS
jgi:hypothetical protein